MTKPCIHTHACQRCGVATLCDGELDPNPDGFPVVVCKSFHLDGGQVDDTFRCAECHANVGAEADEDGEAWSGGFAENH